MISFKCSYYYTANIFVRYLLPVVMLWCYSATHRYSILTLAAYMAREQSGTLSTSGILDILYRFCVLISLTVNLYIHQGCSEPWCIDAAGWITDHLSYLKLFILERGHLGLLKSFIFNHKKITDVFLAKRGHLMAEFTSLQYIVYWFACTIL